MSFRILVTGSRDWKDEKAVAEELTRAASGRQDPVIVHGDCPTGADKMADEWATSEGLRVERHPADWSTHGRAAGPIRNKAMVDLGADLCVAFVGDCTSPRCTRADRPHDSHGATGCARLAESAGITTHVVRAV